MRSLSTSARTTSSLKIWAGDDLQMIVNYKIDLISTQFLFLNSFSLALTQTSMNFFFLDFFSFFLVLDILFPHEPQWV